MNEAEIKEALSGPYRKKLLSYARKLNEIARMENNANSELMKGQITLEDLYPDAMNKAKQNERV